MTPLQEYAHRNTRACSLLVVGQAEREDDPTSSHFAMTPLAAPGEQWPMHRGRPLTFVCQLNIADAPVVPPLLADVKLITFFFDDAELDVGEANGAGWCVRAYRSLDGLTPLRPPEDYQSMLDGAPARWQRVDDHPSLGDDDLIRVPGVEPEETELRNHVGTKLGGYPSIMQSGPFEGVAAAPAYVMQIDTEDKANFTVADSGCIYLGVGTAPGHAGEWFCEWQCY